jgi:hypothetical protein
VERWHPWNAVIAVVLTAGVYALARLLGVAPADALVDAAMAGHQPRILEYWKGFE